MVNRVKTRITLDRSAVKLKVQQVVNKRFLTADFDKEVSAARAKGGALTRAYYGGAIQGISEILADPKMSSIQTGNNPSRVSDIPLLKPPPWLPAESRVALPGQWTPLSKRYIKQPPRSVTFWRKTGILAKLYGAQVAQDKRIHSLNSYYRGNKILLRPTRIGKAAARQGTFSLLLPGLPTPVAKIIRASFAYQRPLRERPAVHRDDPSLAYTLWRVQWPEWTRPWLARYAAEVGKRYRQALRLHSRQ